MTLCILIAVHARTQEAGPATRLTAARRLGSRPPSRTQLAYRPPPDPAGNFSKRSED